ncbi:MAG: peptidase, partial [Methylococcales bacterium]|nr:peptidase [Methylococcales bacterium]
GRQDLAGKTGTTNEQRDAWFNGFTTNNVATAWVGFDDFSPLGNLETGGVTALPMWIEFMRTALTGTPEKPLEASPGIIKAYINPSTGLLTPASNKNGKWEYFQEDHAPTNDPSASQPELGNQTPKLITTEELF